MPTYIYLPVPTDEMRAFAQDWRDGLISKGKAPHVVLYNPAREEAGGKRPLPGYGVLGGVLSADKLYILAHGDAQGSKTIAASRGAVRNHLGKWTGGKWKHYTPERLAEIMVEEELTLGLQDLRLFACGSGLVPPVKGATQSFAQRLDKELKKLGFANIAVTGYLGETKTSYAPRIIGNPMLLARENVARRGVVINNEDFPASTQKVVV